MKNNTIIILLLLSCLIMTVWVGMSPKDKYTIPIDETNVDSVTIYYDNESIAKNISSETDILAVIDTVNNLLLDKTYKMVPTGGLTFYIIFHLEDGTEWICVYYQTHPDGEGYFVDGNVKRKVSNLNALELWQSLSYPEKKGFSIEKFAIPIL